MPEYPEAVRISEISEDVVGGSVRLLADQVDFWLRLPSLLLGVDTAANAQQKRLRAELGEVRNLVDQAFDGSGKAALFNALNLLAQNSDKIERAVVVWVDLIEVLVQHEEQRFGPRAGLGAFKAAEVKKVLIYLLQKQKFNLPSVPPVFMPLVEDILVDWVVDAVVQACNGFGLWVETKPRNGYSLAVWLARTEALLLKLFNPILKVLVSLAIWIRHLAQDRVILSKGVRDALAAVEREGLLVTSAEGTRAVVEVLRWIGTHRDQVIATSKLIFIAVRETETFVSLSGAEKRQYATDLVMAALDDLGFKETSGFLYGLVEALVKCGIEVAVHLLKKRGVFATSQ